MKPDDFEKRLQSQAPRQIPSEWRKEILQAARQSTPSTLDPRPSLLSTISHQLSTALWLKPSAWAPLAAVWIAIFALQSASPKHIGTAATVSAPQRSMFFLSLKDEQQTLVELMGNNQPEDMDHPRHAGPKPRSELRSRYRAV